jgi:hypothetical protein
VERNAEDWETKDARIDVGEINLEATNLSELRDLMSWHIERHKKHGWLHGTTKWQVRLVFVREKDLSCSPE